MGWGCGLHLWVSDFRRQGAPPFPGPPHLTPTLNPSPASVLPADGHALPREGASAISVLSPHRDAGG